MRPIGIVLLSAAAAACSMSIGAPEQMTNPFFTASPLPYQAPPFDRIRDEHYMPAFMEGMRQQALEVRAIATDKSPATFANTIETLERSGVLLKRVSRVFFNLTESTTSPAKLDITTAVTKRRRCSGV